MDHIRECRKNSGRYVAQVVNGKPNPRPLAETLLPKSEWFARSMRKHSDVLELRERLRPLHQTATFGRAVNASQTEAKETLSLHNISQLIYQFLKEHRLEKTLKQFQKESKVPCTKSFTLLFPCSHHPQTDSLPHTT